ncbi:putative deacetylase sulfotransferase [Geminocystis sp. NIES-3708]|uniref:sulfotransferase domain-containing protein n=1 Tax=Geminocystis sp. NIES-3708 TaxID=1615909 RepID=UPI0005FCB046|nr:sulfotransferase domain-containing protein [Geminocystis sp. NIES-3708]BAQ59700.1 putative deacetylase sulfotransferase [Geminocystis sp. NIES-3708]
MIKLAVKNTIYPLIKSSPDFLIIGVQRAGTTSLYKYLINHPQIIISHKLRETYYFDIDDNYDKGFGWYLGHFPFLWNKRNKLTFEASPSYILSSKTMFRIREKLGKIKMILLLRNPVERAYSAWQMFHSYTNISNQKLRDRADNRSFSEAITQELNEPNQINKYPYNYLKRGRYYEQLCNYLEYFSLDELLILDFKEFAKNLNESLNKVSNFLNIDNFSKEEIDLYKQQKYAVATYKISDEDKYLLEKLKDYFMPFNEQLYQLLEINYNW